MPRSTNPFRLRKPGEKPKREGWVYFVQGYGGAIKIGFATDTTARMSALQTASSVPLQYLGAVKGTMALERFYHKTFSYLRLHGEWFSDSPALRAEIKRRCPGRAKFLRKLWNPNPPLAT
jgi:hypothetical protein